MIKVFVKMALFSRLPGIFHTGKDPMRSGSHRQTAAGSPLSFPVERGIKGLNSGAEMNPDTWIQAIIPFPENTGKKNREYDRKNRKIPAIGG
jgi:hypothetical protein